MRRSAIASLLMWLAATLLLAARPAAAGSGAPATWTDAAWGAWDGSGQVTSAPAVVVDPAAQRLFVAARGSDQATWYRIYASGAWGGWAGLAGVSVSEPAVASLGGGRLAVLVRGGDDQLWDDDFDGATWSGWYSLGGILSSSPAAASSGPGLLDVFVRGSDRQLWHKSLTASGWSGWDSLGGALAGGPAAVSASAGQVDVFVRGTDGQLWHRTGGGSGWSGWTSLGGALASAPAASSPGQGHIDLVARGTDGGLWYLAYDGSGWSSWDGLGGAWSSAPAIDSPAAGAFDAFAVGADAAVWHRSSTAGSWTSLGMAPAQNVIGGITYHRQVYALSCEAASLEMGLTHQAIFTTQTDLLDRFGIDGRSGYYSGGVIRWGDPNVNFVGSPDGSELDLTGYGTYDPVVARAAGGLGADVDFAGQGLGTSALYAYALENHPVVAWVSANWTYHASQPWLAFDGRWISYAGPAEHAVLVVGVNAGSVYVLNPIAGPQWVSRSAFEAAFASYNNMAVVLD